MKVLFVSSGEPSLRQQHITEVRKEIFKQHGYEVVSRKIDRCKNDGLKYDYIYFDEFVKLEEEREE